MAQIVHRDTVVTTVFGLVDDDGNAIAQEPVIVQMARFSPEAFADAHDQIALARDRAIAAYVAALEQPADLDDDSSAPVAPEVLPEAIDVR